MYIKIIKNCGNDTGIFIEMWTLPFVICKSSISPGSLRVLYKRNVFKTNFFRCHSESVSPKLKYIKRFPFLDNNHVKLAVNLIDDYSEPESIRWDELTNKLKDSKISNTRLTILRACLEKKNSKAGLSYFNYLINNGEKLTLKDYAIFSSLFIDQKDILKNENVVKNLYDNLKDHMLKSPLILDLVAKLVAEIPSYFFDFVEKSQVKLPRGDTEFMLIKALDYDRFDVALRFLEDHDPVFNENFINAYLNFLTRMAAKHEFLPDLITTLTEICEKKASAFVETNLCARVTSFIESVSQYQNDFSWSASNCQISDKNVCSECGFKLVDKPVSDTDFKTLQENCFKIGLLNKNIFLSSSAKEFESFLTFLNTCKPYDLVIDFLNLFYQVKYFKVEKFNSILQQAVDKGYNVLIIGKKHIKQGILSSRLVKEYIWKDKVQYFLADNMSDDDVFLLYAAMHNGPGKYILSGDYFTHYVPHLEANHKNLFLRWKVYHQIMFVKGRLIPPSSHVNVPQLTTTPDENGRMFVWHLSHKPDCSSPKINSIGEYNWICLRAVKN